MTQKYSKQTNAIGKKTWNYFMNNKILIPNQEVEKNTNCEIIQH